MCDEEILTCDIFLLLTHVRLFLSLHFFLPLSLTPYLIFSFSFMPSIGHSLFHFAFFLYHYSITSVSVFCFLLVSFILLSTLSPFSLFFQFFNLSFSKCLSPNIFHSIGSSLFLSFFFLSLFLSLTHLMQFSFSFTFLASVLSHFFLLFHLPFFCFTFVYLVEEEEEAVGGARRAENEN